MAYINVGCYYLFGLPLGYILGNVAELGVKVMYSLFTILFLFVLNLDELHKFSKT